MLEGGKDAQTPLAGMYNVHDSVSIGSDEMSLGIDENSDAQAHNGNLASKNYKFLEVFGPYNATLQRNK